LDFGILPNFITKITVLPHFSASVLRIFSIVNHIKTKTAS